MKRLTVLLAALALCTCGGDTVAGGGSERPNAPAFTADTHPGAIDAYAPVQGVMFAVTADTDGYAWEPVDTLAADSTGAFVLQELDAGHYSLVVFSGGMLGFSGYFVHDTVTDLGSIGLSGPRTIDGVIYDSTGSRADNIILGLVGTPYYDTVRTGDDGHFLFTAVPAADFKMEIRALSVLRAEWPDSVDAVDSLAVNPDLIAFSNDYISVPGAAPAGTVYVSGYDALPLYSAAVDTVSATGTSIDVVNDAYRIKILTY